MIEERYHRLGVVGFPVGHRAKHLRGDLSGSENSASVRHPRIVHDSPSVRKAAMVGNAGCGGHSPARRFRRSNNRAEARHMSRVMFNCPTTGKPVFSGIEMDASSFASGSIGPVTIRCSACSEIHQLKWEEGFLEAAAA
jgi:hypothetical protein